MANKKWCVYMHTVPNGKKYIGITNDIKVRWGGNGIGYKNCTNFESAIRKYGWINIKHEILFDNLSQEDAWDLETKCIEKYNTTNPTKGYNISTGGKSGYNITTSRRIIQYDNNGKIINVFNNQTDAGIACGISQTIISKICSHLQRTTKDGYVFRYEGDPFDIDNCETDPLKIPIYQLDQDKNIIEEYSCIADAARRIGCHWTSINSALDKDNRKCCEYYWCTKDNFDDFNPSEVNKSRRAFREINQFDLEGNYIKTYKSMREAGDSLGIRHSNISLVCKRERSQAGGYIWRYADEDTENNKL